MKNFQQILELTKGDKRQLSFALGELFFGLTRVNQSMGMILGSARILALQQIDSYLKRKSLDNPAIIYLRELAEYRKQYWGNMINQSHKSQQVWEVRKNEKFATKKRVAQDVNLALGKISDKVKQFEVEWNKDRFRAANQIKMDIPHLYAQEFTRSA